MGKKKLKSPHESDLDVKRNGEIQINNESKRILEKFLAKSYYAGSTQTLRTIVYESKKLETVRVVLEPAQKLVVVHREPVGCRHLLQIARSKLNKKGLNQCFLRCGEEKKILTSTQDLEDGSKVWFEVVEYVAPPIVVEPPAILVAEESDESEEEEFDQDDAVDCFDRARAVNHPVEFPQPRTALPKIDYCANRTTRVKLPIDDFELELAETVQSHSVTVLSAPTGSGKSTRLPQFILAHVCGTLKKHCNIVITEPRRIAAITLADRVAHELHGNSEVGNYEDCLSGFSVRTASRIGPNTRVLFCTVGVLLKRLSHDTALQGVTHVFVDEAHEQDVLTDLLLIFLRDLLATTRPDLKIVILSATMRSETFAQYFAKFSTKQIGVPGSMFPVDFYHLEDLPFLSTIAEQQVKEPQLILHCVEYYIQRCSRSDRENNDLKTVLIFVCGRKDILETISKLRARLTHVELLPLHSQLSNEDQRRVFGPAKPGLRRIVVSTNVAETSVTIPNVGLVVDCGKYKESTYDAERRMQELCPVRISTSAMMQRRGRAGRTSRGTCFHLFSNADVLDDSPVPGMQKDSLESAMVFLKAARRGSNAYQFFAGAPNPPPTLHVHCILEDLTQLGVLQGTFSSDEEKDFTELTPLGFHLAKLGTTCRVGKLLVFGCLFDCIDPVLTIAAALDGKNPFNSFAMKPASLHEIRKHFGQDDFTCFLKAREVYRGAASPLKRFVSNSAMELNEKIRADFVQDLIAAGFLSPQHKQHAEEAVEITEEMDKVLHICLAAGLFPHMGKVTQTGIIFSTGQFGLEKSFFDPTSTLTRVNKNEFFVYHNRIRLSVNALSLQRICVVSPLALILFAGGLMRSRKQSTKLRFTTFKLGTCWMLRCRNRDASMLLQLRRVVNEALLEIYEHKRNNKQHQEMFKVIKSLF